MKQTVTKKHEYNPGQDNSIPATTGMTYGYIRVSTREQNEARQIDAMRSFGIPTNHVFMDKQSGKDFQRPAYQKLLTLLHPTDVLVVKSIDRLGRNYYDILDQWRLITKEIGAAIVVLDMPLLGTRSNRDLTGTLIADIVLQLLSYMAETERTFIRQRQAEGIAAAKARGVRFGHPARPRPICFEQLVAQWQAGEISAREAGRRLGVPHPTFLHWARGESWIRSRKSLKNRIVLEKIVEKAIQMCYTMAM